jgi:hypothetical protein
MPSPAVRLAATDPVEPPRDVQADPPPDPAGALKPLLLDSRAAARLLGISTRSLWSLTARGELLCVRPIGRRTKRYRLVDLVGYAAALQGQR